MNRRTRAVYQHDVGCVTEPSTPSSFAVMLFAPGRRFARSACLVVLMEVLLGGCATLPDSVVRTPSAAIPASTDTPLGRLAAASTPDPALSGFRLMPAGPFALSTRIELARRAQRSLDLQYYTINNDATGRYLLRTLRDAAQRGVRVRLLKDDLYTAETDLLLLGLAAHRNVEVRLFNPFPAGRESLSTRLLASLFDFARVNHRMHNKLFIADGAMAVAGGRNIGNEYFTRHEVGNLIDLDVFATGAVVPQLASLFDRYWNSAAVFPLLSIVGADEPPAALRDSFERMTGPDSTPPPQPAQGTDALGYGPLIEDLDDGRLGLIWGSAQAHADPPEKAFAMSRPTEVSTAVDFDGVRLSVVEHARRARSEVVVVSPYLIPGRKGMEMIRQASERGVKLSILTNSLASTDEPLVHIGYRRYRADMLRLGVELYEFSPLHARRLLRRDLFGFAIGGLHTKMVVFDREDVFIGSLNFDLRSELHNTEMGLIVHSAELAREALRLAQGVKRQAAYRLRLAADGSIEWLDAGDDDGEVHGDEPETGIWLRLLLELLAPLAPEELL
ncbi:MAG: phospholipase D family protein [Burkholderiaceae bacterium]